MKFIHTSDWHIGRLFHNMSLLDDQKHVLAQLVEHVKNHEVDALIVAGDIYDRSVPPASAVKVLDDTLHQLCEELSVPVIMIPGNHDSAVRVSFGSRQLKGAGLHILGDLENVAEPIVIPSKDGDVSFYGIPFNNPEMVRNAFSVDVRSFDDAHTFMVEKIKESWDPSQRNVLISHCFIDGSQESDSERPLSIGGSDRVSFEPCLDFDYVALGHLHAPQKRGAEHIRYSGSIMKYSFSEQLQKKGVTLVELDKNDGAICTHLPLIPLRDMRIIEGEMSELIDKGRTDPNSDDYVLVRINDTKAIMDAMAMIREVYPNALKLEKTAIQRSNSVVLSRDQIKRNELDMFHDFFEQVQGESMTAEQGKLMTEIVSSLHKEDLA